MTDKPQLPEINSEWTHYKGNEYKVYDLLNTDADPGRELEHPVIVCYRGANGKKWGKPLPEFLKKMTPKPESAWVQRRERINSMVCDATKLGLLDNVDAYTVSTQADVIPLIPKIQLWDESIPQGVGAFAHIAVNPRSQELVDDSQKLQFIQELWASCNTQCDIRASRYSHVARSWAHLIELGQLTVVERERLYEHHVAYIGLFNPNRPMISGWYTSYGGDLQELTTFLSILRHIARKYKNEIYDYSHVHQMKDDFNQLVNVATANRQFHLSSEPRALVENFKLRFLLPRRLLGPNDSEPQYVETRVEDSAIIIVFPPQILELIVNIFGENCLE